jgi:hypothetical protein
VRKTRPWYSQPLGDKKSEKMNLFSKFETEIREISEFKEMWKRYVVLMRQDRLPAPEHEAKRQLRENLNLMIPAVSRYVRKCGVSTSVYYTPPPIVGGMAGNIDLFANMYNLHQYEVPEEILVDLLDKAIGTYRFFQKEYKERIFNPFYWIGRIIKIPFRIAEFAGFDPGKLEISIFGKLYKLIAALIILLASIATILQFCNIKLNDIKLLFK